MKPLAEKHGVSEEAALTDFLLEKQPSKRWVEVEEVARMALYLAGPGSGAVNGAAPWRKASRTMCIFGMGQQFVLRSVESPMAYFLVLLLMVGSLTPSVWAQQLSQREQWRRPTRLAATPHGLMVGNRDSGSISWISPSLDTIQGEWAVVKRLADFAYLPRHDVIVVADDVEQQLVAVCWAAGRWHVVDLRPFPQRHATCCS